MSAEPVVQRVRIPNPTPMEWAKWALGHRLEAFGQRLVELGRDLMPRRRVRIYTGGHFADGDPMFGEVDVDPCSVGMIVYRQEGHHASMEYHARPVEGEDPGAHHFAIRTENGEE